MILHGTATIDEKGQLFIGGINTQELAAQFGTPLIIYDVQFIREKIQELKSAFAETGVNYQIAYASKAFSCLAIVQLMQREGLSLDVVSSGELHTALMAGFPAERIHFHGNNKSLEEIEMAVNAGVGCFVVDNFYELTLLEHVAKKKNTTVNLLIRTSPGIEAETHEYILTGQEDSKFGFDLNSGQAEQAVKDIEDNPAFHLLGLHFHIGSQIFETTGFILAIEKLYSYIEKWHKQFAFVPHVINLGGGFGIKYTEKDSPLPLATYIDETVRSVKEQTKRLGLKMPEIWIEPGRSLVGEAGTTLYTIGSEKLIPSIRHYVSVDGGMSDNLRPALYDAEYEAILANRAHEKKDTVVTIAGKCCESGDILIKDLSLPLPKQGDLLAMFSTGAYGYAMSNNYNRIPRPAVVFVENGEVQLVIKRESLEDLVSLDLPLNSVLTNLS